MRTNEPTTAENSKMKTTTSTYGGRAWNWKQLSAKTWHAMQMSKDGTICVRDTRGSFRHCKSFAAHDPYFSQELHEQKIHREACKIAQERADGTRN